MLVINNLVTSDFRIFLYSLCMFHIYAFYVVVHSRNYTSRNSCLAYSHCKNYRKFMFNLTFGHIGLSMLFYDVGQRIKSGNLAI
jgi:hypothetical protein